MAYRCHTCNEEHDDLPDIGFQKPEPWFDVPEEELARRVVLTADTCVIDDEHYFIRGVLLIPIVDRPEGPPFGFGVWVSQKKENFEAYVDSPDSDEIGPFFGWLSTRIPCYEEDTFLLKTRAHFQGGNRRPLIELEPTDHPLSIDNREGITLARAWEIVHEYIMH